MIRWSVLLLLLLAGLGPVAAAEAKEKLPDTDLSGLTVLMGGEAAPPAIPAPSPTPAGVAATSAPAPAATGELTLDRFALGFGLIVVGTLGAAVIMLIMRRVRRSVNTIMAQAGDTGEQRNK